MFDDTSGWHAGVRRVRTLGSSMSTKSPTQLVGIPAVTKASTAFRMSNIGSLTVLTIIVYVGLLLVLTLLTSID